MHDPYHLVPLRNFNIMLGGPDIETGSLEKNITGLINQIIFLLRTKRPEPYQGYTSLMLYAYIGKFKELSQELEKEVDITQAVELEIDGKSVFKMSALDFAACSSISITCLKTLFSTGYFSLANAEQAIFFAAEFGNDQAINYFHREKINLFSDSFLTGFTPLHVACIRGHTSVVSIIVQHAWFHPIPEDTRIAAKTKKDEKTAYQYAKQNKHYDCAALINAYYFHRILSTIDEKDETKISQIRALLEMSVGITDIALMRVSVTRDFKPEIIKTEVTQRLAHSLIGSVAFNALNDRYYEKIFFLLEKYLDGRSVTEQVDNYVVAVSDFLINLGVSRKSDPDHIMVSRLLDKLNTLRDQFDQVKRLKINAATQHQALWSLILNILASSPLREITFHATLELEPYEPGGDFYNLLSGSHTFNLNKNHYMAAILSILNNPNNTALIRLNIIGIGVPPLLKHTILSPWIKTLNMLVERNKSVAQANSNLEKISIFNRYNTSLNLLMSEIKNNENQPQERNDLPTLQMKQAVYPLKELIEHSITNFGKKAETTTSEVRAIAQNNV